MQYCKNISWVRVCVCLCLCVCVKRNWQQLSLVKLDSFLINSLHNCLAKLSPNVDSILQVGQSWNDFVAKPVCCVRDVARIAACWGSSLPPLWCCSNTRWSVAGIKAAVEGDRGCDGRVRSFGHHQLQDAEDVVAGSQTRETRKMIIQNTSSS